jgi:hypothetical protein
MVTVVKAKVKCNQCGKVTEYEPNYMWTISPPEVVTIAENTGAVHFCSWKCIGEFAQKMESN